MANRDIVVIGASAGGIEALQQLLRGLPSDLEASILIVLHTSRHAGSLLPAILQRASGMPTQHPVDGTPLKKGQVYIAPPDFHMVVEDSLIRVLQGPVKTFIGRPSTPSSGPLPPPTATGSSASSLPDCSTMGPPA